MNKNKNLSKIILASIIIFFTSTVNISSNNGCCSWNGGVKGCDVYIGKLVCNNGTISNSCSCNKINCGIGKVINEVKRKCEIKKVCSINEAYIKHSNSCICKDGYILNKKNICTVDYYSKYIFPIIDFLGFLLGIFIVISIIGFLTIGIEYLFILYILMNNILLYLVIILKPFISKNKFLYLSIKLTVLSNGEKIDKNTINLIISSRDKIITEDDLLKIVKLEKVTILNILKIIK